MKTKVKAMAARALACAVFLCLASVAMATPTLQLTSGATIVTVADGDVLDVNPNAGVVTFIGTVGSWNLNTSTGTTKPAQGTALLPFVDLNSVDAASSGATNPLMIEFSETGFTGLWPGFKLAAGGTLASGATADFQALIDNTNVLFGGSSIGTLGPFGPGGAFAGEVISAAAPTSPYSLTLIANLNHPVGQTLSSSFNFELTGVPEPGFYGALALGLGGLITVITRRRKSNPV